ncbi:MAG: hypothetical protein HY675_06200 [Chloroflexi bacterium]|nr:hypothetical protein [Chloroflexota bacterium]
MPVNFSIKNVPDDVAERLRARAKRNRRSLQGELLVILERVAESERSDQALVVLEDMLPDRITFEEADRIVKALNLPKTQDSTEIIREMRDARYGG